jgi:hypothetical protein
MVRYVVAQQYRTNHTCSWTADGKKKDSEMNGRKHSLEDSLQISPDVNF